MFTEKAGNSALVKRVLAHWGLLFGLLESGIAKHAMKNQTQGFLWFTFFFFFSFSFWKEIIVSVLLNNTGIYDMWVNKCYVYLAMWL